MTHSFVLSNRRTQRGAALITTLGVLMLMSLSLLSILGLVGSVMQSAQRRTDAAEAFNVADAGADLARLWLSQKSQNRPPLASELNWGGTTAFFGTNGTITDPFRTGSAQTTLLVRIDADTCNTDTTLTQKRYLIESQARLPSGVTQTVREYVQQTSFGHYAIFVDQNPGSAYWSNDQHVFDGPVHSNNSDGGSPPQPTGAANNILWHSEAGAKPIFTYNAPDAFTVSGPTINFWKDSFYNTVTPTTEADWKKIAVAGSAGIKTGAPMIGFPPGGSRRWQQRDAALGSGSVPAASGVSINADGGIYIHCKNSSSPSNTAPALNNDVQSMTLGVDGAGRQTVTVQQGSDYRDGSSNQEKMVTIMTIYPGVGVYVKSANFVGPNPPDLVGYSNLDGSKPYQLGVLQSGGTNGVLYCDGNVGNQNGDDANVGAASQKTGGLSGTVADHVALTVATDPGDPADLSGHPPKNLNINGNIVYKTPRQKYQNGDTLPPGYSVGDYKPEALDAGNFKTQAGTLGIVSNNVEGTRYSGTGTSSELTSLEVDASVFAYGTYDACDYALRPLGSMLNMGGYLVGTRGIFGTPSNGIPCSRLYDNRLGTAPPPYFPTTGSLYEVISWQRTSAPLP